MALKLYNTLTRKKEAFKPIKKGFVGIYSCGPTVYWNQHIGHMYAYIQWDSLVKLFRFLGFKVKWVMNITDVGHLTSDSDTGEDKMEKGAKREGLTVWQISEKYTKQFLESMKLLNISTPDVLSKATDHIKEQIILAAKIEKRGFTYKTKTGLVFDTSKFADYAKFARLDLEKQEAGSRVKVDPEKKKPWDFLLWVINKPNHIMQWQSPWGKGFPGWHIECTAMSVKYLGQKFDIHTGGREHIPVHHTNEIAQAYGAFGTQTANFWIHNEWLTLKGEKMSKSKGDFVTVQDLQAKGYPPLALRYLILTSHYRTGLNFSWEALTGARAALGSLYTVFHYWSDDGDLDFQKVEKWKQKFVDSLSDDLNWPRAMAVVWDMVRSSELSEKEKKHLLIDLDRVLGFDFLGKSSSIKIPNKVEKLRKEHEKLRKSGEYKKSDKLRVGAKSMGYELRTNSSGATIAVPSDFLS